MSKISLQVEVSKETYELGQGLRALAGAVKLALADGFQVGSDVPVLVMAAVQDLFPAVQGVDQLGAEAAEDKAAFVKAISLSVADLYDDLAKPSAAPVEAPPAA